MLFVKGILSGMNENPMSAMRLRIGFFLIMLWWIPVWAAAPTISKAIGTTDVALVTTVIIVIQTLIGLGGFLIVGKPIAAIVKKTSFKKAPGIIFYAIIHGKIKEQV
jgi:hypothetical protein